MPHRHDDPVIRRLSWLALCLAALLAVLQLAAPAFAEPAYPKLTGRVTDAAAILPAETVAALDARLKALEDTTGTQLVVATVPSLDGYEIEEYGVGLLRTWGIGQKDVNNGAILLVAPNERKVRIEVGYGLEGVLTDAMSSQIIRRDIIPQFKAGDMAGGVTAGADALIALLGLPPDQQAQQVAAAATAASDNAAANGNISPIAVIFWVIVILWMVGAMGGGRRGRRRGPVVIWGPGLGGSWSSGGGGSDWGGGGGGFGGGGGSGGGGGASGGW